MFGGYTLATGCEVTSGGGSGATNGGTGLEEADAASCEGADEWVPVRAGTLGWTAAGAPEPDVGADGALAVANTSGPGAGGRSGVASFFSVPDQAVVWRRQGKQCASAAA